MTDEELGRAWCEKHGRKPKVYEDHAIWLRPTWDFGATDFSESKCTLSPVVWSVLRTMQYQSESAAYAALGAALRRIADHIAITEPQS